MIVLFKLKLEYFNFVVSFETREYEFFNFVPFQVCFDY